MKLYKAAFSLIEILLVVATISLLAAIIFAAMGPAREGARQRVCASNLHQIGQALSMYMVDYDGAEAVQGVPMQYWQVGLPSPAAVPRFLSAYRLSRPVLLCPDYHGNTPVDRLMMTYSWVPDADEHYSSRYKFSNILSLRGGDAPLLTDEEHNPPLNLQKEPRWTLKRVMVLRLNQQVQINQVPLRSTFETW